MVRLVVTAVSLTFFLSACGISKYPGQPGVQTDGYSKIDMEYLDESGLFVYEAVYNNKKGGDGVAALITKFYEGARTYTSNVRTNADGSLYHVKQEYKGASIEVIAMPATQQVYLKPGSLVQLYLSYDVSMNEIDTKNISEENIFATIVPQQWIRLSQKAWESRSQLWEIARAGKLGIDGRLSYQVEKVVLGNVEIVPSAPVSVMSNVYQSGLQANLDSETRAKLISIIDENFPKGFQGTVKLYIKGQQKPLSITLGIQTINGLVNAGYKISTFKNQADAVSILESI